MLLRKNRQWRIFSILWNMEGPRVSRVLHKLFFCQFYQLSFRFCDLGSYVAWMNINCQKTCTCRGKSVSLHIHLLFFKFVVSSVFQILCLWQPSSGGICLISNYIIPYLPNYLSIPIPNQFWSAASFWSSHWSVAVVNKHCQDPGSKSQDDQQAICSSCGGRRKRRRGQWNLSESFVRTAILTSWKQHVRVSSSWLF